ncbi:MAG TPA: hypothetical protein VFE51_17185 [Verrucomicrobiae bacterium]|nr:hypothetical protein [Verrucomicrobiae bacterium]
MADIKFACPHCSQHITCDELWGGHQLNCPSCNNPLTVPAKPAPAAATGPAALVPKPPPAPEPRLAINAAHSAGSAPGAGAPQRTIPIRNLTPPPPKKKSPLVTVAIVSGTLLVLGVGGYYGYGFVSKMQNKVTTASNEAAKNADGGQVGHIANLYQTLDATEPGKMPIDRRSAGPRQRRSGVGQEIPVAAGGDMAAGSTNVDNEPLVPAVWTLDLTKARIPSGRANGSISGTNFVPQTARVDPLGNAQVLRLIQGQPVSPDREVLVYLHLKAGEKLGGQNINVSQDMAGVGVPQVTKRWKTNPKFAPQYKSFTSGYAMRLELGQPSDGLVAGKIFLALPDPDQSVVAGAFKASINTNAPVAVETTVQAAPAMTPASQSAADAAWQARYGVRRAQ